MSLQRLSSEQPPVDDLRQYERQALESQATGLPLASAAPALAAADPVYRRLGGRQPHLPAPAMIAGHC